MPAMQGYDDPGIDHHSEIVFHDFQFCYPLSRNFIILYTSVRADQTYMENGTTFRSGKVVAQSFFRMVLFAGKVPVSYKKEIS